MFNQPLSNTLSIAELAPKAATRTAEPVRGDGAFGAALAGARTVHDRRESQVDRSRGDSPRADRTTDRSTTESRDRATTSRADRADQSGRADRATNTDRTADASAAADDAAAATDAAPADSSAPVDGDAAVTTPDGTPVTDDAPVAEVDPELVNVDADAATQPTAAATVAVAAAPVADLDAIIVPTAGTPTQVASDAVDAAIRLAIAPTGEAATDAAPTTTVIAAAAATDVEVDGDAKLIPTTTAHTQPGAEDAETGDVQGPTRPLTSAPATTSGPSPAAAATTTATQGAAPAAATVTAAATTTVAASADATIDAAVTAATTGTRTEASAQLGQVAATVAAAVDADADPAADADATQPAALLATADDDVDAEVAQRPAQLATAATPQQAAQATYAAQAQAKAAEQAAEEGGEQTAPTKLEPASQQLQGAGSTGRADQLAAQARIREGIQLGGSIQERIDNIASQLATRLRLSQAAGGSEVQLSLKPRELGDVHVQMKVRDGQVAAIILVDKPETARTMQGNIEELKRSLESQGLQIQQFSVDVRGDAGAGGANARAAAELRDALGGGGRRGSDTNELAGVAGVNPGLDGDRVVDVDSLHDGDVSILA